MDQHAMPQHPVSARGHEAEAQGFPLNRKTCVCRLILPIALSCWIPVGLLLLLLAACRLLLLASVASAGKDVEQSRGG